MLSGQNNKLFTLGGACVTQSQIGMCFLIITGILREAYLKQKTYSRMLSAFQNTFMTEPCNKSSLGGRLLISLT